MLGDGLGEERRGERNESGGCWCADEREARMSEDRVLCFV